MLKNNLKRLRGDLRQKSVADYVGITQQQYSNIERSDRAPSFEVALKLSKFFKKPIEKIFFEIQDNNQLSEEFQKEVV